MLRAYWQKTSETSLYFSVIMIVLSIFISHQYSYQKEPNGSAHVILNPVCFWTSSKELSFATSVSTSFPFLFSKTANSVMTIETTPFAVRGSVHSGSSFSSFSPLFVSAECCIRTITRDPELTKSMAPPIPFINFPGIIQLAISQF